MRLLVGDDNVYIILYVVMLCTRYSFLSICILCYSSVDNTNGGSNNLKLYEYVFLIYRAYSNSCLNFLYCFSIYQDMEYKVMVNEADITQLWDFHNRVFQEARKYGTKLVEYYEGRTLEALSELSQYKKQYPKKSIRRRDK